MGLARHGVPFERLADMDRATIRVAPDRRFDYGEDRFVVTGQIDGRVHVAVVTDRDGWCRIISLRKANRREERTWRSSHL